MRVEIDLEQAINNASLRGWFFRQQAIDQYDELERVLKDGYDLCELLEEMYDDLDDLEEDLYSMDLSEWIDNIGEEYFNIEDEEEEEDE